MTEKYPRHIVAVSAHVTNDAGEMLLVKTHWRSDTWEQPGGQVEEGEALDMAVVREVWEETGITISPLGITGVYYNASNHVLSVVFRASYISGALKIQPEEIKQAGFFTINEDTIDSYITRPHFRSRTIDSIRTTHFVPYETWDGHTKNLLGRLNQ